MVVVFIGSMTAGIVRQYPTYSNAWANLRSFSGGCGLADDVLVEPDPNAGFLTPLPGTTGPSARSVASSRSALPPMVCRNILSPNRFG